MNYVFESSLESDLPQSRGDLPGSVKTNGFDLGLKRVFDVIIAIMVLLFTFPFLLIIGLIIKVQDGGPALFKQDRIGHGQLTFTCLKFRTMHVDAPERLKTILATDMEAAAEWARDHKLRHDPRITRFGYFLRKTSLDELPQLLNIIKGEMSLVGPRPIVLDEVEKYGDYFFFYTLVRPGVTGSWQVNGRSDTTYTERIALDVSYVQSRTFIKDFAIIFKTIPVILGLRGAY